MLTQTSEKQGKYQEVLESAESLYRQDPDWVSFFRQVLGVEGTVRRAFPAFEDLAKFEQSEEFDKIQKFLVRLREKRTASDVEGEPTRVITVRLPKSMHEALRTEAHDLRTSMNKLCISKLLQVIDETMIPNERTGASTRSDGSSNGSTGVTANRGGTTGGAGFGGSFGGQPHSGVAYTGQHQPTSTTVPFKPQPRF